jgi:hypothetical protein
LAASFDVRVNARKGRNVLTGEARGGYGMEQGVVYPRNSRDFAEVLLLFFLGLAQLHWSYGVAPVLGLKFELFFATSNSCTHHYGN